MDIITQQILEITDSYEHVEECIAQLLPDMLTVEQCQQYDLPETHVGFHSPTYVRPPLLHGIATHDNGKAMDAKVFERINIEEMINHILAYCPQKLKKPPNRPDLNNPGIVSAGRLEFYITGPRSELIFGDDGWLMKEANRYDGGRPYKHVWKKLLREAKSKAEAFLESDLGYDKIDRIKSKFSCFSILVHQRGHGSYQRQPPHIDAVQNQTQFLVALSHDCKPVYVYEGNINLSYGNVIDSLDRTAQEEQMADKVMAAWGLDRKVLPYASPLFLSRRKLDRCMKPAIRGRPFQPGEFAAGSGPLIHAGPETDSDEFRAVMFFSTHVTHCTGPYDNEFTLMPFIAPIYANSSKLLYQTVSEWADYNPEKHFPIYTKVFKAISVGGEDRRDRTMKDLRKFTESESLCRFCNARLGHEVDCGCIEQNLPP
jgi:hypothetical protein